MTRLANHTCFPIRWNRGKIYAQRAQCVEDYPATEPAFHARSLVYVIAHVAARRGAGWSRRSAVMPACPLPRKDIFTVRPDQVSPSQRRFVSLFRVGLMPSERLPCDPAHALQPGKRRWPGFVYRTWIQARYRHRRCWIPMLRNRTQYQVMWRAYSSFRSAPHSPQPAASPSPAGLRQPGSWSARGISR